MNPKDVDQVLAGLAKYGIQYQSHTSDGLVSHLRGTYEFLRRWGCESDICLAGLCHSVYGTESYKKETVPLSERDHLRGLIGQRAERLSYLFGAHVKDSLWKNLRGTPAKFSIQDRFADQSESISGEELNGLLVITLANWLEQRPRAGVEYQFLRKEEFLMAGPRLPEVAFDEFKRIYGIS